MTEEKFLWFPDLLDRARQGHDAAAAVPGPSNGFGYLCGSDAFQMVVRVVLGDSAGEHEQRLECQHCQRFFEFPWIESQRESGRLFEVMEQARQGNQAAKAALLLILETERKPAILRKLSLGDVRCQDRRDADHDVVIRADEKIHQLRMARAYFKWEILGCSTSRIYKLLKKGKSRSRGLLTGYARNGKGKSEAKSESRICNANHRSGFQGASFIRSCPALSFGEERRSTWLTSRNESVRKQGSRAV